MAAKFYEAKNCNRKIVAGDRQFLFEPYANVGTWWGVYSTADPAEQAALDALVANPKSGVMAITEEEYKVAQQKKTREFPENYAPLIPNPRPAPQSIAVPAAQVVESSDTEIVHEAEPEPTVETPEAEHAEALVQTGEVEPAQPVPAGHKPRGKSKKSQSETQTE